MNVGGSVLQSFLLIDWVLELLLVWQSIVVQLCWSPLAAAVLPSKPCHSLILVRIVGRRLFLIRQEGVLVFI